WLTPIHMKKNRPAVTLSILCSLADEKELTGIVFEEGITLGIRRQLIDRFSLPREIKIVKTKFGDIRVKVARYEGKIVRAVPEYDDCKKTAAEKKVSIQTVMDSARDIFLSTLFRN
ncbi:MAG: nickel insertion protein, partial [Patescibacteria group bacterium]|nr:nickel insertion protein [Patescibacteria group bacterium]